MGRRTLQVGIIGGGKGGLAAAIGAARGGADVTLLEAARELGEIGAGIQIVGENLVAHEECNTYYGPDAELIAYSDPKDMARNTGFPWWVVRRDHLHAGLVESAKQHGVNMVVNCRVSAIDDTGPQVRLQTTAGQTYTFDVVLGADGIRSFVRSTLFPGLTPQAPSKMAAYRGVLAYSDIFAAVPDAWHFLRNTMDVFLGPRGFILCYPMSGGWDCNIVTAFVKDDFCTKMEEVDVNEFQSYYKDYHPTIQAVIKLVNYTQRWPLLQMPRMESWSNAKKNIALLGDAVHCMQNTMGQGAATAMEDGASLGAVLGEVVRGTISVKEAVSLYEEKRMPRGWTKQQISFVSGLVNTTTDRIPERNAASKIESEARMRNLVAFPPMPSVYRSWQYFCNFASMPSVFSYDAEGDADFAVCEFLQNRFDMDETGMVTNGLKDKWWGYVDDNGVDGPGKNGRRQNGHAGLTEQDYARHGKGL